MSARSSRRSGAGGTSQTLNPATIPLLDRNRLLKELSDRGLLTTGNKNVLADRLYDFVVNGVTVSAQPAEEHASTSESNVPEPPAKTTPKKRKAPAVKVEDSAQAITLKVEPADDYEQETVTEVTPSKKGRRSQNKVETTPQSKSPEKKKAGRQSLRKAVTVKIEPADEEPQQQEEPAPSPVVKRGKKKVVVVKLEENAEEPVTKPAAEEQEETTTVLKKGSKKVSVKLEEPSVAQEPEPVVEMIVEQPDQKPPPPTVKVEVEEEVTKETRRLRSNKRARYSPETAPKRAKATVQEYEPIPSDSDEERVEEETSNDVTQEVVGDDGVVEGTIDLEALYASGVKPKRSSFEFKNDDLYTASSSGEESEGTNSRKNSISEKPGIEKDKRENVKKEEKMIKKVPKIAPKPRPTNNWKEEWAKKLAEQKLVATTATSSSSSSSTPLTVTTSVTPTVAAVPSPYRKPSKEDPSATVSTTPRVSADVAPRQIQKRASSSTTSNISKSILDDIIGDKPVIPAKKDSKIAMSRPLPSTRTSNTVVTTSAPPPSATSAQRLAPPPPPPPPPRVAPAPQPPIVHPPGMSRPLASSVAQGSQPPPPPPPLPTSSRPPEVTRRRSRFDQPPPEYLMMQRMAAGGVPPPPPPIRMYQPPPALQITHPPVCLPPGVSPGTPKSSSGTPSSQYQQLVASVTSPLTSPAASLSPAQRFKALTSSSGVPPPPPPKLVQIKKDGVPPPPPPRLVVPRKPSPPPPPPSRAMTEEERVYKKKQEALLAMERAAREHTVPKEVMKNWMPVLSSTKLPSSVDKNKATTSTDSKSLKLAQTINTLLKPTVEEEDGNEEDDGTQMVAEDKKSGTTQSQRIEAGREAPTKEVKQTIKKEPKSEVNDDGEDDFVIREVCIDVDNGGKVVSTVESAITTTGLVTNEAVERKETEMEYDPFENTIIEDGTEYYEYVPSFLEVVNEEEVETSIIEVEKVIETIQIDDDEEDDDIVILKESNPRDLLRRALPVLQSLEKENQVTTIGDDADDDQYCEILNNEVVEEEKAKNPDDQYFHGEPVTEPDDNELFLIAAGMKPKKKEKKLVEIPEEEKPPSADQVQLDYYNGDLHVKSAEDKAHLVEPFTNDGLALMWGGVRTNYGIKLPLGPEAAGMDPVKIGFQVRIDQYQPTQHLPTEFMEKGDFRVGFALDSAPFILGEYNGSWCISASGKKATRNNFQYFGDTFDENDVVTCIMDLTNGTLSYLKNGEPMGVAFNFIDIQHDDQLLFPSVCTQNCNAYVNLGDCPENEKLEWNVPEERDWKFITELDRSCLIKTPDAPESKSQCTVLMTVGLPGVGKTCWVRRYLADHEDEQWTLISADRVMDAMRVNGVPRNRLPSLKRLDFLRGMIGKSMARLVMLAPRRRRNYLLDMTNCMIDKRKRKLLVFQDFERKCVVFVPDEDVHAKRLIQQEQEENEKLDTDAMMQYKAGISIPTLEDDPCEEVLFVDPPPPYEHLAFERVRKMNEECRAWFNEQGGRRRNSNLLGLPPLPPLQNSSHASRTMNLSPLALPTRPKIHVTTFQSSATSSSQPSPLVIKTNTDSDGGSVQNTPVKEEPATSWAAVQKFEPRERTNSISSIGTSSLSPLVKKELMVKKEPEVIKVDLTKLQPAKKPMINIRLKPTLSHQQPSTSYQPPIAAMPDLSAPPPNFSVPPPAFGTPLRLGVAEPLKITTPTQLNFSTGNTAGQKSSPIPVLGSPATMRHHAPPQLVHQHHQFPSFSHPPPNFSQPPPSLSAPYQNPWGHQLANQVTAMPVLSTSVTPQQQPQQQQVQPSPSTPYAWQTGYGPPPGQF